MGKKYKNAIKGYDPLKKYSVAEACSILPKTKISSKWDETVDVSVRLGVNPKYADQMVRGSVVMPSGTGKSKRVLGRPRPLATTDPQPARRDRGDRDLRHLADAKRGGRRCHVEPRGELRDPRCRRGWEAGSQAGRCLGEDGR